MKWASWVNVVLGLWLVAAPFALGYSGQTTPTTQAVVVGIAIAGCALWAAVSASAPAWLNYVLLVCGAWSIIAPFALGYTDLQAALYNDVVSGALVGVIAMTQVVLSAGVLRQKPA